MRASDALLLICVFAACARRAPTPAEQHSAQTAESPTRAGEAEFATEPARATRPEPRGGASAEHALPTSVDLRPRFEALGLVPRPQGPRPTCSIFTATAALEFACSHAARRSVRLSVEYLNWAANAATGRDDDGDFFHHALAGWERFGLAPEEALPYAGTYDARLVPGPDALVAAGRVLASEGARLRVRWILPWQAGQSGLDTAQFEDARSTLAAGWPVAAGSSHSRLLVGYVEDTTKPGGGVFWTIDSGLGGYGEVDYTFARTRINDAFTVEVVDER